MSLFQSIILGLLQGIGEFIPVSSSGHLALLEHVMGLGQVPLLYDVLLHVATLSVVFVVFRKLIGRILVSCLRWVGGKATDEDKPQLAMALAVILATVMTVAIGLPIEKLALDRYPKLVAGFLVVSGLILLVGTWLSKRGNRRTSLHWTDGLLVGLAQGVGVLPGISRSGITISAGLACGLERSLAGEFSFIMSIPAILGALVLSLKDASELTVSVDPAVLAGGMLAAALSGFAALVILMKLVRGGRLGWFALYLVPAGIAGMILL